jgi:PAS domain S-box-containing protein
VSGDSVRRENEVSNTYPSFDAQSIVFDHIDQGVIVRNATGQIVFANAAAARIFGLSSADELVSKPLECITTNVRLLDERENPITLERALQPAGDEVADNNSPVVLVRFSENNELRWYRVRVRSTLAGSTHDALEIAVWEDVTERRRAAEPTRLLAAIVATSDDAIVSKRLDGTVTSWNRGAERLFGWTAEEMVGNSIARIVPPDKLEELAHILARLGRGEKVEHHETTRITRSGKLIDVSVSISPILDGNGQVIGAAKIGRDITFRREAERFADAFLADLAHDVNTPLATAKLQTRLLLRRFSNGSLEEQKAVDSLTSVESSIARVSRRIGELSDVSRLRLSGTLELSPAETDLVELVTGVIRSNQLRDRITLTSSPAHLIGYWDAQRLERVFDNLLSNALKYSESQCQVDIQLDTGVDENTRHAVVTVTDFGIGIPDTDLPYVFDRFRRGSNVIGQIAGTGIGLAGARQIIELHGGQIAIASEAGSGTTVTVILPIAMPALSSGGRD